MSIQERKHTGTCRKCGRVTYSQVSVEMGLCGMCHRFLREGGMSPHVLQYLLSRDLSLDWEARP